MSQHLYLEIKTVKASQVLRGGGGSSEVGTMSQLLLFFFIEGFPKSVAGERTQGFAEDGEKCKDCDYFVLYYDWSGPHCWNLYNEPN